MKRILSAVVALAMTLALCASVLVPSFAAGSGRTGSITVDFQSDASGTQKYLAGDTFSLKQIVDETGEPTPDLKRFSYDWYALNNEDLQAAIDKVDAYCRQQKLYETSGKTNAEGKVTFSGLTPGIYLFARTAFAEDNKDYVALSGIVAIPSEDPETGGMLWDMTVQPKPGYNGQATPADPEDPRYVPDPKTTTTTTRAPTTTKKTSGTTTRPNAVRRIANRVNTDSARPLTVALAAVAASGAVLILLALLRRRNRDENSP